MRSPLSPVSLIDILTALLWMIASHLAIYLQRTGVLSRERHAKLFRQQLLWRPVRQCAVTPVLTLRENFYG